MELWRWENKVLWDNVLPHPANPPSPPPPPSVCCLQNGTCNIIAADWKQRLCQAPHQECRHLLLVMSFPLNRSARHVGEQHAAFLPKVDVFKQRTLPNILFCHSRRKEDTSVCACLLLNSTLLSQTFTMGHPRWRLTLHTCSIFICLSISNLFMTLAWCQRWDWPCVVQCILSTYFGAKSFTQIFNCCSRTRKPSSLSHDFTEWFIVCRVPLHAFSSQF